MMSDGISEVDIARLVDAFCAHVRDDPALAPVFHDVLGETEAEWVAHWPSCADSGRPSCCAAAPIMVIPIQRISACPSYGRYRLAGLNTCEHSVLQPYPGGDDIASSAVQHVFLCSYCRDLMFEVKTPGGGLLCQNA